ncbi:CAP domain-containing protein [Solwaraspora sp. WMMD1047]|uniref:CAP domain-containing protein n=1 Tax=Solwaraspora sp. WMMD1047 TaxID=3016102 RepID=UPI002417E103|nr:CAP domain-containing protein [Solwaraspora sp. WMMD1047]MDG4829527.1 CAP domain-containing protein [Solwaraspora sp. WMMD1047]
MHGWTDPIDQDGTPWRTEPSADRQPYPPSGQWGGRSGPADDARPHNGHLPNGFPEYNPPGEGYPEFHREPAGRSTEPAWDRSAATSHAPDPYQTDPPHPADRYGADGYGANRYDADRYRVDDADRYRVDGADRYGDDPYRADGEHPLDPYDDDAATGDGSGRGPDSRPAPRPAGSRRVEPDQTRSGRHRSPGRWPLPIGLAVLVGVLLLGLGIGAALLPPSFAGDGDDARPANAAGDLPEPGAGEAEYGLLGEESPPAAPSPDATPTPSPSAAAAPTPSATPSKARRSSPTPTRTRSRAAAPAAAPTADTREGQVIELVNRERTANGCGTVQSNNQLATASRLHSEDQAETENMSHTGSDGSSPWDRAERAGYRRAIGENVAAGYRTPAAVMEGWMNSPGHRANILNCDAKAIGVGIAAAADGTLYWTQMFGSVA